MVFLSYNKIYKIRLIFIPHLHRLILNNILKNFNFFLFWLRTGILIFILAWLLLILYLNFIFTCSRRYFILKIWISFFLLISKGHLIRHFLILIRLFFIFFLFLVIRFCWFSLYKYIWIFIFSTFKSYFIVNINIFLLNIFIMRIF